jgi:diguanylate cyclase (GGDEF)-like protein
LFRTQHFTSFLFYWSSENDILAAMLSYLVELVENVKRILLQSRSEEELSSRIVVHRSASLLGFLISVFLISPMNSLTAFGYLHQIVILGFGLSCGIFYMLSRHWQIHLYRLFLLNVIIASILLWFSDAGSFGSMPYYFFLIIVYPVAMFKKNESWVWMISAIGILVLLIFLEYFFPELVYTYPSREVRVYDFVTGILAALFALIYLLRTTMGSALLNSEKVYKQNDLLRKKIIELKESQRLDPQTGLLQRSVIQNSLQNLIDLEVSQEHLCSIGLVDIDHFSLINDETGFKNSEKILLFIAQTLQNTLPKSVKIGRYGGDEFLMIIPNMPIEAIYEYLERVQVILGSTGRVSKSVHKLSLSGGLVEYNNESCEELLTLLRNYMLRAKKQGRSQFLSYLDFPERK